jgi:hypothetical protein
MSETQPGRHTDEQSPSVSDGGRHRLIGSKIVNDLVGDIRSIDRDFADCRTSQNLAKINFLLPFFHASFDAAFLAAA